VAGRRLLPYPPAASRRAAKGHRRKAVEQFVKVSLIACLVLRGRREMQDGVSKLLGGHSGRADSVFRRCQQNTRTALVTGASSGIGEATARLLKNRGFTVHAVARRVERMKALEAEGIHILPLDIAEEVSIRTCVDTILEREDRVSFCAGYCRTAFLIG
jgi:hypothetical protein